MQLMFRVRVAYGCLAEVTSVGMVIVRCRGCFTARLAEAPVTRDRGCVSVHVLANALQFSRQMKCSRQMISLGLPVQHTAQSGRRDDSYLVLVMFTSGQQALVRDGHT